MDSFQRPFVNIDREKKIAPHEVAMLIAPPLTQDRFKEELRYPTLSDRIRVRIRDFIPTNATLYPNWKVYNSAIAYPILLELKELRTKTSCYIIPDVKFEDFKKALTYDAFKVVFLVAHQIPPEKYRKKGLENGGVEFVDGGVSLDRVSNFLKTEAANRRSVSFVYLICELQKIAEAAMPDLPAFNMIASAYWKLPFVRCIQFAKTWIMQLDGGKTLSEAYDEAITQFLSQ